MSHPNISLFPYCWVNFSTAKSVINLFIALNHWHSFPLMYGKKTIYHGKCE